MAFNPVPTNLIASWSEDGTNITFPIASVPELTAAEADAVTGDSRKIIYALIERICEWHADLAVADRPTKMTVTRGNAFETAGGTFTRNYNLQFVLDSGAALDVADEV